MSLPVSNLVNVTINLAPLSAAVRNFGVLMIAGDSNVISGAQRIRQYSNLEGVAADFGVSAPEYFASALYFSQVPKPSELLIGRWIRAATSGFNQGEILNSAQSALANFTAVTSGGFHVAIDGAAADSVTALNLSGATNLNAVAALVSAGLTGATCAFNGQSFVITSNSTGAGVQASGTITLNGQPSANDTVTVDGTVVTFVAGTPVGSQVQIGASTSLTSANLQAFLAASIDSNIDQATYSSALNVTTVLFKIIGTSGNSFTLAKSGANIAVSGATLSGGTFGSSVGYATAPASGTDISALLGLTAATSLALVPGYSAESPVQAIEALEALSTSWYSSMFAASVMPTNAQNIAVSGFIEGVSVTRQFGVTITDTSVLSSLVSNDLASQMSNAGYNQSLCQYSENSYAVASLFGRYATVDFTAQNSTITLMYKQEPSVVAETLTVSQAATLQAKNCNVFVNYDNDTAIIQYGVMASGEYIDTIQGVDWFQNAVQTACYNLLYTSTTKVPQTDSGMTQLSNAIAGVCDAAVNNGLVGPGTWTAGGFGQLQTGQFLKTGYYIFANPLALQSQSDREARMAPPIQVAIKLAGAIQLVNVIVNVNQ